MPATEIMTTTHRHTSQADQDLKLHDVKFSSKLQSSIRVELTQVARLVVVGAGRLVHVCLGINGINVYAAAIWHVRHELLA